MENQLNKLNIEFLEHMGYYIPKTDVEGFDPDTYFDGPILDEKGLCGDKHCQELGYCRNKVKRERKKSSNYKKPINQFEIPFE